VARWTRIVPAAMVAGLLGSTAAGLIAVRHGPLRVAWAQKADTVVEQDRFEALARGAVLLADARARAKRRPDDGVAWLRVALLEMNRSNLLAVVAYEQEGRSHPGTSEDDGQHYVAWRDQFLRADDDSCLNRARHATQVALGLRLDVQMRREAFLILAAVRVGQGDALAEASALAQAARCGANQPSLWVAAATAYARAGRFYQAYAALRRAGPLDMGVPACADRSDRQMAEAPGAR
jgi:hypothetical protein